MEAYLGYIMLGIVAVSVYVFWLLVHHEKKKAERRDGCACVKCGYDLRGTPDRCPECGLDLHEVDIDPNMPLDAEALAEEVQGEAIDVRTPEPWEQKVLIHSSVVRMEASALADQLELRGIVSVLREVESPRRPGDVYLLQSQASWGVWVSDVDLPAAQGYVASLRRARRMRKSLHGRANQRDASR